MKTLALSLLATLACATAAWADGVYDNTQTPANNATFGSSVGQSFVTGGTALSLNAIAFAQNNENNVAYTFTPGETMSLYANNPVDNTPLITPVPLASFNLFGIGGGFTEGDVNTTTGPTLLTINTRYWLVLSAPPAGTVYWTFTNPNLYTATSAYGVNLPTANTAFNTRNGVTTFYAFDQGPQSLYIDADPVLGPVAPEPSTYAMFALGGLGACFLLRRARAVRAA